MYISYFCETKIECSFLSREEKEAQKCQMKHFKRASAFVWVEADGERGGCVCKAKHEIINTYNTNNHVELFERCVSASGGFHRVEYGGESFCVKGLDLAFA